MRTDRPSGSNVNSKAWLFFKNSEIISANYTTGSRTQQRLICESVHVSSKKERNAEGSRPHSGVSGRCGSVMDKIQKVLW